MWMIAAKAISRIRRKINPCRFQDGPAVRLLELLPSIRARGSFPARFHAHAGNCDVAVAKNHIGK
jgi:hypothetical protein